MRTPAPGQPQTPAMAASIFFSKRRINSRMPSTGSRSPSISATDECWLGLIPGLAIGIRFETRCIDLG